MRRRRSLVRGCPLLACAALSALGLVFPVAGAAQATAALAAVARSDCEAALDALNHGLADGEAATYRLAGELYETGMCLRKDAAKAAGLFARAAAAGDAGAARSLALLEARGQGVAQSYAAAGYGFAVMRHERPDSVAAPPLDAHAAPDAIARTYVEAVQDLAEDEARYPDEAAVQGVQGSVAMHFDPRTGIATVIASRDNKGSSATDFGPSRHLFERVTTAAYETATRELPKPELPTDGDLVSDRVVAFDRDRNSRRTNQGLYRVTPF